MRIGWANGPVAGEIEVAEISKFDHAFSESEFLELAAGADPLRLGNGPAWHLSCGNNRCRDLGDLKYDANGLIPAIIQDIDTGEVLMMAYMNKTSLEKSIQTGKTHFWSRSRKKYWMKGETSGHTTAR